MKQRFAEIKRSPDCCGCASFPLALCGPCHRFNYTEDNGEPILDPTNPPIDATGIKPDAYCTYALPQMKTCNLLAETPDYYIYDNDGRPGVVEKEKCRIVSIAVSVLR